MPFELANSLPLRTSQSFTVLSALALANIRPSDQTQAPDLFRMPFERAKQLAAFTSQSFTVLFALALASLRPCGSNATLRT